MFKLICLAWLGTLGLLAVRPALGQQLPASRLAPSLRRTLGAGTAHATGAVRVKVRDEAAFRQWASQTLPSAQLTALGDKLVQVSQLSAKQVGVLATAPLVEFVDQADRPVHDERLLNGADLTVNKLRAVQRRYPALRGQGLVVSIKENPLDPTDLDFRGRLLNTPAGTTIESAHASIMATLIAGSGNSGPAGEGAAPAAGIASSSYARLLPDDNSQLTQLGVSVQNHSYGTAVENYYGLEALGYDQQTRQLPTLLHVFSSGNSGRSASLDGTYQNLAGWANLTGQFKQSKNSLSVGATDALGQVAPLSSRGPAYDGRLKPELVAFGDAGSSDAAALVSGAALLVQQAYRDGPGAGQLPPAALVKAALLNSADDVGTPQVDFVAGFGQLNALGAVRTVQAGRYWQSSVGAGQLVTFNLNVPAGAVALKVTLAWTDPEAAANAATALVNDLDLQVQGPAGTSYLPWTLSAYPNPDSLALPARRRPDHRNNVEQVTLTLPAAGTYQLRVRGPAVSTASQTFSVAYEAVLPGFEWLVPSQVRNVRPGQATQLRWAWPGPAALGQLEYRPVGSASWRVIASSLDLSQRTYSWAAPDTTCLAQLRCVVAGQQYPSDTFALARPLLVTVGYVCAEETLLTWPAVPHATGYQLYTLSAAALEPFQLVADTLLVLPPASSARQYFAVAPVLGGRVAERGPTASLAGAGVGCYIRSFLPAPDVADTVRLQLLLGSRYRLRTLQLQRLGPTGFETIQTLNPVPSLSIQFTDLTAAPGANQYRVVGQDAAGRTFYSATVTVQLVRGGELLVYPVPVVAGQDLLVAGEPGQNFSLTLYDVLGRRLRTSQGSAAINLLSTNGLWPGVYLLQAAPVAGGAPLTRRVVVQ